MPDEKMIDIAMHIITDAGDARLAINDALTCVGNSDFAGANGKIVEARKLIAKAHGMQTDVIQSEAEGELREHPLLFIHAQDTLMTVNSELNLCRKLCDVFLHLDTRLSALENTGKDN